MKVPQSVLFGIGEGCVHHGCRSCASDGLRRMRRVTTSAAAAAAGVPSALRAALCVVRKVGRGRSLLSGRARISLTCTQGKVITAQVRTCPSRTVRTQPHDVVSHDAETAHRRPSLPCTNC
eukprot:365706-Chlamydomonas_euryale.AAC.5